MTAYRDLAPRVDIIVPAWGNETLTETCLRSIFASRTAVPYRVLYVDNGSPRFYKLLSTFVDEPRLTVVRLPFNHGFCRGTNVGLSLAALNGTEFVMLLNNDVEVPEDAGDWLGRLLAPFSDPQVGAVGAVSDNVFGQQRRSGPGQGVTEAKVLIGFAMVVRGAALRQVGLLDERFEPGNFEDFDYSLRLRQAGYKLVVAESVWLHHVMHASQVDLEALLRVNRAKLVEKWDGRLAEMGIAV